MKLSIVVPAHNEEERIGRMLDAYTSYFFERYADEAEFVVVVNASTDGTAQLVRTYEEAHPHVRLVVEPKSVGKGGAVILGFQVSEGDLIGFVDADGSTPPEAFDDLAQHIGDAGAIIANRWHPEANVSPRQPFSRRMASRIFNGMVRLLFKLSISDTQCGAKLMTREAIQRVLPHLGLTRWAFDVDLLFQLRRQGFRIIELPTTWQDVAGSKLNVSRASSEMFLAICRLRLLYSPFHGIVDLYNRIFGPLIHKEH